MGVQHQQPELGTDSEYKGHEHVWIRIYALQNGQYLARVDNKSEGKAERITACKVCRDLLKSMSFVTINIFFLTQLYLSCISVGQILPANRNTPSPIDPETIQVPVGYEPDPADLALSSIPGQEMFDPRKRKFSEEELKPQPMIKKARKVFIPDDLKVIWNW